MEEHTLIKTYMRYSKRIVIFGIAQWCVIAAACVAVATLPMLEFTETMASFFKHALTCASTVAVTTTTSYYAHSLVEENMKKNMTAIVDKALNNKDGEG